MSANAALLSCPLCLNNCAFGSVETLRDRLIFISTNKISCPMCQDEIIGIDKLTIHLFTHIKVPSLKILKEKCEVVSDTKQCEPEENKQTIQERQKKSRSNTCKNKTSTLNSNSSVKFVKIYPKLPTVPPAQQPMGLNSSKITFDNSMQTCLSKLQVTNKTPNTICDLCGLQFINESILKMHRCLIHNIDENSNQQTTRYDCHLCPKNFKMRGSLMVHLRVAHLGFTSNKFRTDENINHDTKNANVFDSQENKPIERNDNKQWQCDVCRKCFTTKYFLKKHKRLHTGETPYACTQCNKTFTFQQSYHKHLLYHNDEKPHSCSYCGRAFKELSTLHNHQRIHTGEKPFSCETCGKCFRQRVSYLVHRRIHTGVMPYKCTACDKSFRYKVSQRTHKCPAQPPGTVIRQSGDLVEKLKKKHADIEPEINQLDEIKYPDLSEANAELVRTGAQLSLEDTESEHFNLIAEAFNDVNFDTINMDSKLNTEDAETKTKNGNNDLENKLEDLIDSVPDNSVPSPSEILKNLCLSKEEPNYDFNLFL